MLDRCVLDRAVGSSKKFELYLIDQGCQNSYFGKGPDRTIFLPRGSYCFFLNYSVLHCSVEAAIDDM